MLDSYGITLLRTRSTCPTNILANTFQAIFYIDPTR